MRAQPSSQAELEKLKRRVAELEHALELHEWGGQLFHASMLPQLLVDLETGAILAANAAAQNFYGAALLRRAQADCLCAEGLEWIRDIRTLIAQQRYGMRVSRQYTQNNEERIVEAHYVLLSLRGREVVHFTIVDITEKMEIQRELEASRNRYQAFVQLSTEGIWRDMMTEPIPVQLPIERQIDLIFERSYLAECNQMFCRIWSATKQGELLGTFTRERMPPDDLLNRELMRQFIVNGYRLSNWMHKAHLPNGSVGYALCSFQGIVHDGLLWGQWGIFRDITDIMTLQEALRQSEERYRTFIQYANEGIWRFDISTPIPTDLPAEQQVELIFERAYLAECNQAFAKMYAVDSLESIIGAALPELLIPTERQNREMLRHFVSNEYRVEGFVSKERAVDGSERYFLNSFFGIVENGALVRAWGVQTDITEMRRLQEQLDQAYRLESIGRLAGGIAHDFNNILTAVMGFTELARGRIHDETTLRYLDGVTQAAERAANLNRQLLAYARRQIVQLAPTDLSVWLNGVLDILRRVLPENIHLKTHIEQPLEHIHADPNLLLQIVLNLVVNARDAMPQGGVIKLDLQKRTIRRSRLNTIPNGRYIALTVTDTGTGIAPDVLPHIFEPFFSTKSFGHGTGMGLAAVQGAVQQLGGYIEVQTELGKGTSFTIFFPCLVSPKPTRRSGDTPPG
ncbi:MAG: hypothetical protein KatS3mg019_0552 [Fimbriimonadales bacterium]|nr:MAG: hypothetical protein KatS3mg019_0552 [Fimbriimonadales bacterium]